MVRIKRKVGRDDLCPCDSGKKYKMCCLKIDIAIVESIAYLTRTL